MKKYIVLFVLGFLFSSCNIVEHKEAVLCGTTILASMARDCMPKAEVDVICPAGQCPGHFDMKPTDIKKVAKAKVVLLHPFQKHYADKIENVYPDAEIKYVSTVNTTIPENYFNGIAETAAILTEAFPKEERGIKNNSYSAIQYIAVYTGKEAPFLRGVKEKAPVVLCAVFQKGLAEWLGMKVCGVFADPETLSVKEVSALVKTAKEKKAEFIISNLAGPHDATAASVNKELNLPVAVFSNFPEMKEARSWYINLWDYNMKQLKNIMAFSD